MFDFEPVMHKNVPPAHFGYMATGIDDEVTLRANREGFQKFQLLPRRLVDVSQLDLTMELFGRTYGSPVVLAPTGSNKAFHEDGDLAVSRAAAPDQQPADPVDRGDGLDRAGDRGARPARLVPALPHQQMGGGRGPGQARREGRRGDHRRHGRRAGAAELGDLRAPVAHRQAQLRGVPRAGPGELREAQAQLRRARPLRHRARRAPPASPGRSSSACATR